MAGDENRLTGLAGLPVDLNPYRTQYGEPTHSVAAIRPLPGLYDFVFDTPSVTKSGSSPYFSKAYMRPVRPKLAWTSSRMKHMSLSRQNC